MSRLKLFALALASAALGSALPALAQTTDRTEVIAVTPPDNWVQSTWQGGTFEIGEFTPLGQTGGRYIDLLGYSALPRTPSGPANLDDLRSVERATADDGCRVARYTERAGANGWVNLARLCIGRQGEAPDVVELEFATTTVTQQGVYRVWRSHRDSIANIWGPSGLPAPPIGDPTQAEFEALVAAREPTLRSDLERREICDMARPSDCRAFAESLPSPFEERFQAQGGYLAAVHLPGLNQITRERFLEIFEAEDDGGPNQVIVGLVPGRLDWTDTAAVRSLLTALAWGHAADGGVLALLNPDNALSPEEQTQLRVRLIESARQLMKNDRSPAIVTIAIPAG